MAHPQTQWLTQWPTIPYSQSNPFSSNAFLQSLETSHTCHVKTGWEPMHLRLDERIFVPCYLKHHSYGEYVFDAVWAHAYSQYQLNYYPKLVVAIPYTPSIGPRFIHAKSASDVAAIVEALQTQTQKLNASGFHILFPNAQEQHWLDQCSLLKRTDIQFHWKNRDYTHFDDFLSTFMSRKRKVIRKERLSIEAQNIDIKRYRGDQISPELWKAFYVFYHSTYLKRGRLGYLNETFFNQILTHLADQLLLIMAFQNDQPIAAALFFHDDNTLYGRYWGAQQYYPNLHFEVCYYQGIDYCIENKVPHFDPGTQGEHKISRGFEPTYTHSYHWLQQPDFMDAAHAFCVEETQHKQIDFQYFTQKLPFRSAQ